VGQISFVHLIPNAAASTSMQIVVPKAVCRKFPVGGAAKVSGKWVKSMGAGQEMELMADSFTLMQQTNELMMVSSFHYL
jgi:aspartyl/asparaginyl-tRNA synthetase